MTKSVVKKPAKNAFEFLKKCRRSIVETYLKAKETIELLQIDDTVKSEDVIMCSKSLYTAKYLMTAAEDVALRFWGLIEVENALKKLNVEHPFVITTSIVEEIGRKKK